MELPLCSNGGVELRWGHRVGIGIGIEIGKLSEQLGGTWQTASIFGRVGMSWHIYQDAQCGQTLPIGPSHAKSHQITCHLPNVCPLLPPVHMDGPRALTFRNAPMAPFQPYTYVTVS